MEDRFKETRNNMKRQSTKWEKTFEDDVTKGLTSKIYKQLIQLKVKKENNNKKKMSRRPKQTFLQKRHTNG